MNESSRFRSFPTTHWTVIRNATNDEPVQSQAALTQLCESYWYPLYSFIRRRGYSPEDSQDLVQDFYAHLLEKRGLQKVDPDQGRFRTFLLAALKNFLANDWDRTNALKRGGGQTITSLQQDSAESRYQQEPAHDLTPERHFERQWALTLLDQVLVSLRHEYHSVGKAPLFEELKGTLAGRSAGYAEIARRLGQTEGAIKVAAHRLRHRYRELMRARIADTVGPDDVDDEVRHLFTALQG